MYGLRHDWLQGRRTTGFKFGGNDHRLQGRRQRGRLTGDDDNADIDNTDILTGRRSLLEVKRRGQWKTDASLRRYGREAKVMQEMLKIPAATLEYGQFVAKYLEEVFHQTVLTNPPIIEPPAKRRL